MIHLDNTVYDSRGREQSPPRIRLRTLLELRSRTKVSELLRTRVVDCTWQGDEACFCSGWDGDADDDDDGGTRLLDHRR